MELQRPAARKGKVNIYAVACPRDRLRSLIINYANQFFRKECISIYTVVFKYTDGSVIAREFGVYTEAIVALCAGINAAQIEGIFNSCEFRKDVEE